MLRIMLVDDESNVTRALRRTLTRSLPGESFSIETFDDPRLALERAGEVDFALVISDYRMPPMDGVEFLMRFRIMQPDAVRLILSASSDVEGLLAAINQAGAFRYILKPWDDIDLAYIVREALLAFKEQSASWKGVPKSGNGRGWKPRSLVSRRCAGGRLARSCLTTRIEKPPTPEKQMKLSHPTGLPSYVRSGAALEQTSTSASGRRVSSVFR